MKTVLIIGVGQFGSHIARRMEELRCEVMAVDENEERINNILPYVTNARIGDSTNEEFLRSLGVGNSTTLEEDFLSASIRCFSTLQIVSTAILPCLSREL